MASERGRRQCLLNKVFIENNLQWSGKKLCNKYNVYQVQIWRKKAEALQLGIRIQKGDKKVVRVSIQLSGESDKESTVK